jgi:hypothetical protein
MGMLLCARRPVRRARLLLHGAAAWLFASTLHAQRPTANDAMVWAALIGEHRVAKHTSLYWDHHARRADAGATWQINLGAVGITRELTPQWRVTGALGWSLGYRYGAFPARFNSAELRPWVQLSGTRKVGTWTWSDRSRAELRLLHPVGDLAPPDADWSPSVVRLRRMDRFQHRLTADNRWYASLTQEWLLNASPPSARFTFLEQSRTQAVVGRQVQKYVRAEAGYGLQRFNRRNGIEMNHTLLMYLRFNAPIR